MSSLNLGKVHRKVHKSRGSKKYSKSCSKSSKKNSTRRSKSSKRGSKPEYVFKDIIIYKNTVKYENDAGKRKANSISISENGLVWVHWKNGRIYFGLDKLNDSNVAKIKILKNNNKNKIISFKYIGDWEQWGSK